jgi:P63C domain
MATDIVCANEFWTVVSTGESATSLRGLSRLSGIPQRTIVDWFLSDLSHEGIPKQLKPLAGKTLYLSGEIKRRGKLIKPVLMDIAMEVVEYAAFDLGKPIARVTYKEFAKIGATSYAQGQTGWLPIEKQSSRQSRSLIDFILNDPKAWTVHFKPQWREDACRVTGYRWHPSRPMAQFISTYIYKALPADVYERLLTVNAERKSRHHQFFDDIADDVVLKEHIQQVGGLLRVSRSKQHFSLLVGSPTLYRFG